MRRSALRCASYFLVVATPGVQLCRQVECGMGRYCEIPTEWNLETVKDLLLKEEKIMSNLRL